MVPIIVRKDEKARTYYMYEARLCRRSALFQAACLRRWERHEHGPIYLEEQGRRAFEIYIKSVEHESTADLGARPKEVVDDVFGGPEISDRNRWVRRVVLLSHAWILGDYLPDNYFKNTAIDAVQRCDKEMSTFSVRVVNVVFDSTKANSALQRYLLDTTAESSRLRPYAADLTSDYVFTLVERLCEMIEDGDRGHRAKKAPDKCKYHEHGEGEECSN